MIQNLLKMVKKTVVLSQNNIDKVWGIAKQMKSPGAKRGDFSKALRKIIEEYDRKIQTNN